MRVAKYIKRSKWKIIIIIIIIIIIPKTEKIDIKFTYRLCSCAC